jgi:hypothetical protein
MIMNTRREARQLAPGDQFEVSLTLQLELVQAIKQEDGRLTLRAKVVPCGAACGEDCDCGSRVFKDCIGPFDFILKGSQRVPFHGNLQQLLADSERLKQQIARLGGAEGSASFADVDSVSPLDSNRKE